MEQKDGADSGFTEGSTESSDGNDNAGATAERAQGFIDAAITAEVADRFQRGSTTLTADINLIMTNAPVNRMHSGMPWILVYLVLR